MRFSDQFSVPSQDKWLDKIRSELKERFENNFYYSPLEDVTIPAAIRDQRETREIITPFDRWKLGVILEDYTEVQQKALTNYGEIGLLYSLKEIEKLDDFEVIINEGDQIIWFDQTIERKGIAIDLKSEGILNWLQRLKSGEELDVLVVKLDMDILFNIASLRALRILYAQFDQNFPLRIITSPKGTETDSSVSLIRSSYIHTSSILGGGDTLLSSHPFDPTNRWSYYHLNVLEILRTECGLAENRDYTAGSFYFSYFTEQLAKKWWADA